ncbi:MAG TPA: 6-phospho-beta-glucosidase [Pseudonocardiaceae bacterium]
MKLAILGGGGFRVPLVYRALLDQHGPNRITELHLHDVDQTRLRVIGAVLDELADGVADAPKVNVTTSLDDAILGADFVFSAIRVGGLAGRTIDERVALREGVLGQETVGAGGIAYGLRTVPVAIDIASRVARLAPDAWLINFTNPAGLVTEAMSAELGSRVIGICDSPVGLGRRVADALGVDPETARFDYAGLNHLGWLRRVEVNGIDQLPRFLADPAAHRSFEESRLFGPEWLRTLGSVPNEYLYYYYFTRETIAAATEAAQTRGEFLRDQQARFYRDAAEGGPALPIWERTRAEREATYMAEARTEDRDAVDLSGGGYEQLALSLMRAIAEDRPTTLILNVRNSIGLSGLDGEAIVEVPCFVDGNGARPLSVAPLDEHQAGLVSSVKAVDRATIAAAVSGSRRSALRALALHPLVDSATVAGRLLDGYLAEHAQLAYLR